MTAYRTSTIKRTRRTKLAFLRAWAEHLEGVGP